VRAEHADEASALSPEQRLEDLFRRCQHTVVSYVARRSEPELIEDIVAETFLVAWRRLDDIPAEPLPWLLGVARNILATQRRSARRRRALLLRLERERVPPVGAGEVPAPADVAEALAQLSEKDREAILLIAWDWLTPKEAAEVLGELPVSVRVRLHRAKRRLRRLLEAEASAQSRPLALLAKEISTNQGELQ
jgi:RNA polymerase sigma-70 factor, ECF subfamily